jgi:hypothetical protein
MGQLCSRQSGVNCKLNGVKLCTLFGVRAKRGGHCVKPVAMPERISATLKPSKSKGCRFVAKPNVAATPREALPAPSFRVPDNPTTAQEPKHYGVRGDLSNRAPVGL